MDLGQIEYPLYKSTEDETYSLISYERASEIITRRIEQLIQRTASFMHLEDHPMKPHSHWISCEISGCNHINTCSNYCHEASGIALSATIGATDKSISYDDLKNSDLIFVIGANPTSNHPRFAKILRDFKRDGKRIVAINLS